MLLCTASSGWTTFTATGPVQGRVPGEEDHAHAAIAQLPLQAVLGTKRRLQAAQEFGGSSHGLQARSRVGETANRPRRWTGDMPPLTHLGR